LAVRNSISTDLHAKKENNEGEAGNLVEKTTGKIKLKIARRKFEEEEEGESSQTVSLRLSSLPLLRLSNIVFR
jgi:hypothetical protein